MPDAVTVAIPSIPPRLTKLSRALRSVAEQTHPVQAVALAYDHGHQGAAFTRNRALGMVHTEWTAFLDDDDELRPRHIEALLAGAHESNADVIYPWFDVPEGWDPFPQYEGKEFRPSWLGTQNMIPVTTLVRTELLLTVGGFQPAGPPDNPCEDWGAWRAMLAAGARFHHVNERTWLYHWHGQNTSGRGDRW